VPPGPVELSFSLSGFRSARRQVDAREGTRVDVSLSRGVPLHGVVLADGTGVAEAEVWARSSVAGAEHGNAVTDRTGRFTMRGLSPGRYSVSARGPDGEEAQVEDVDVETAGVLRLALRRTATAVLIGRVVGLPESEEEQLVFVQASGEQASGSARLDAAGTFRMEKTPAGHVRVQATAVSLGGSARASRVSEIELAPGSEGEVVLEFSDDIVVSGTVTRDGLPAVGAVVTFRAGRNRAWAPADGSGHYTIVGLEPGLYQVDVAGPDLSFETEFEVTASAQLDIDASGAAVGGTVTDATTGAPITGAEVSLWLLDTAETWPASTLHTGAAGTFVARGVREGRYRLLASKDGYGQDVAEVELRRGRPAEVALALAPAEGLTVEVVDARDGRALDAVVVVRDTSRRIVANRHSGVAADGTLTIPLSAGSYLLSTSAHGYGTATVSVTAPGHGLRVPLTPGGTLVVVSPRDLRGRLRLVRPDGEEYVRCWCNGIATMDLEGRRTTIPNVRPDRYTAELLDAQGRPAAAPQAVVIQEGRVSTLAVE
jgi:protocatechuate 3,4-dioxygenase beta subunit